MKEEHQDIEHCMCQDHWTMDSHLGMFGKLQGNYEFCKYFDDFKDKEVPIGVLDLYYKHFVGCLGLDANNYQVVVAKD